MLRAMNRWLSGEWAVQRTDARRRRMIHYWLTIAWLTIGLVLWLVLRNALWFVGFMSLYAIWITHLAGWAAETPVEPEDQDAETELDGPPAAAAAEPNAAIDSPVQALSSAGPGGRMTIG
jgi:hypothetical protein